jgi:hypothetical protein
MSWGILYKGFTCYLVHGENEIYLRYVYLLDRRIRIPFWGLDGGVGAGAVCVGSLILIRP